MNFREIVNHVALIFLQIQPFGSGKVLISAHTIQIGLFKVRKIKKCKSEVLKKLQQSLVVSLSMPVPIAIFPSNQSYM